jgi:hypothetical protein
MPGFVVAVPGYRQPWCLVTTALDRSAAPGVEACAARCRREDGCCDHTQRLGMAACRAWPKEPGRRTFQVPMVALALRRRPCRLAQTSGMGNWGATSEGYPQNRQGAIRDLGRLCWRHRGACSPLLVALEEREKSCQAVALHGTPVNRAARNPGNYCLVQLPIKGGWNYAA